MSARARHGLTCVRSSARPCVTVMDSFLGGLIWDGDQVDAPAVVGGGVFPPAADRWHPNVLLVCLPEAVTAVASSAGPSQTVSRIAVQEVAPGSSTATKE